MVSLSNHGGLTMRIVSPLITLDLILSLSKDEGGFHGFSAVCCLKRRQPVRQHRQRACRNGSAVGYAASKGGVLAEPHFCSAKA